MQADPGSKFQSDDGELDVDLEKTWDTSSLGVYHVSNEVHGEGSFARVKSACSSCCFYPGWCSMTGWMCYSEARHIVTGHQVAMKIIQKQKILEVKTKQRVRREYEYLRALRHPHIIKL
jgi:serine/threonine protein kinase